MFITTSATHLIYTLSLHDALPIYIGSWVIPGILCALLYLCMSLPLARAARALEMRWRSSTAIAVVLLAMAPSLFGEVPRSEEHTSELQSQSNLVCRLLLEKKNIIK